MNSENLNSPKKRREARAIDALKLLDPSTAAANVRPGTPGREPDWVISKDGQTIGVEVVEYYTPVLPGHRWSLRQRRPVYERILLNAMQNCRKGRINNVFATVEFDDHVEIEADHVDSIAAQLSGALEPVSSGTQKSVTYRRSRSLPCCIKELWAYHREEIDVTFIGRAHGGIVPEVDERELLRLINDKEGKISQYRENCDAVWLLVVVDQYQPDSTGCVSPYYRLTASVFDRVLVLQGWSYTIDLWGTAA